MKIKKNTLYMTGILIIVVVAAFFFMRSSENSGNNGGQVIVDDDVQNVFISMKDFNYYPQEIRVKVGQPVAIYLDETVGGCFRDLTIPDLNLRKYLATPDDSLVFTPTEKGRYTFACSMRMGAGTLIVE